MRSSIFITAAGLLASGLFDGCAAHATGTGCDPIPSPYSGKAHGKTINWFAKTMTVIEGNATTQHRVDVLNDHIVTITGNNKQNGGCAGVACCGQSIIVACNDGEKQINSNMGVLLNTAIEVKNNCTYNGYGDFLGKSPQKFDQSTGMPYNVIIAKGKCDDTFEMYGEGHVTKLKNYGPIQGNDGDPCDAR